MILSTFCTHCNQIKCANEKWVIHNYVGYSSHGGTLAVECREVCLLDVTLPNLYMTISCMCSLSSDWHVCTWLTHTCTLAHRHWLQRYSRHRSFKTVSNWGMHTCAVRLVRRFDVCVRVSVLCSWTQLVVLCWLEQCVPLGAYLMRRLFCTHCLGQKFIFNPSQKKQHVLCLQSDRSWISCCRVPRVVIWFVL